MRGLVEPGEQSHPHPAPAGDPSAEQRDLLGQRTTPAEREAAYAQFVDGILRARLPVAAGLVATLMVLGGLLAVVLRPDAPPYTLVVRGGVLGMALLFIPLARRPLARGRGLLLAFLLALGLAVELEVQILQTGGVSSPYAAGMSLLIITLGLLFPFSAPQAAAGAGLVTAIYVGPLLPVAAPQLSHFVVQLFFLLAASLVAVAVARSVGAVRRSEFLAQLALAEEQERSERLLFNILPRPIADRLRATGCSPVDGFEEATILFADIVGFTQLAARVSPAELMDLLNRVFSTFDDLAERHGLEKIKTIGDAYMVVGGLPAPRADHAEAVADMALAMVQATSALVLPDGSTLRIRVGINTGPVVAGVIGHKKFIYDLWGDAVNTASRMESHGEPGAIHVTHETYLRLRAGFVLEERGPIAIKGKGEMVTYFLLGKRQG